MVGDILQPTHLLFVLVVALLVLGPKRLPEVGRALGNGLRDFKAAIDGHDDHRHDKSGQDHGYDEPDLGDDSKHVFAGDVEPPPDEKHEFAYEGSEPASEPAASNPSAPSPTEVASAPPEPIEPAPAASSPTEPASAAPQPTMPTPAAPRPSDSQD